MGILEGKRPLENPKLRWEYDIKIYLQGVGWAMDWTYLAQDMDRWQLL
jgi:hypothetical protein